MALNLEFEDPFIDLRNESTIKRLIKEGRPPCLIAFDGEEKLDKTICFIPAINEKPAETFEISFEEAGKIAKIRDRLQREAKAQTS